ncbi:AtzE family amidohydrolase [Acetobacter sp. TBRC 12305]|uniref:AtzE family amidohydrolase n=1 Tax=Acetobacter garciniae TaxID=2817435 RepID=A0A939KN97_9PROT|nr:AtzE family amidohydrolase [Acetobacter garciniae]MBO1325450.1 AtzE family amidohydrolase [Acetobacter garciniae]MBX0345378.1 AtzE family amidohydrolase [Acetobacter garciniae]
MTRFASALDLAADIRSGKTTALAVITDVLATIRQHDAPINSVTHLFEEQALERARQIDAMRARGQALPPLAGVPFGVKDLFDVAGHVTTAGSVVLRDTPPATQDAAIVQRLKAAGAIVVATLNMDEFAYGFATDNAHYGITRNPHDTARMAGGSSGGSAASVAAGFLPFTLGSDTNGSIRVPAALCGVWGLKPTFGRLPRQGAYPFSASLDVVGHFAGTLDDLISTFHVMDASLPVAGPDVKTLKIARLGGWFAADIVPALEQAIAHVCNALGTADRIELPETPQARAASFLITACEGGNLHLPRLRAQAMAYDAATRDRLLAGAMLPANTYIQAQRFRSRFRRAVHAAFRQADVLIAPAVACEAPRLDSPTIEIGGKLVSARANLGCFTQPISLPGLPVLTLPLLDTHTLPLGLQLVAAPGRETALFSVARELARQGLAGRVPMQHAPPGATPDT